MSNDVKNLQRQNVDVEKKLARAQSGQNSRSMQEKTRKHQNGHRQRTDMSERQAREPYEVEDLQAQ